MAVATAAPTSAGAADIASSRTTNGNGNGNASASSSKQPSQSLIYAVPTGIAVGKGIPADVPHAVSVSLPRWQDNIDYEEGRLADSMETGYPRFFIHQNIQKLASHVALKFGQPHESCLLLPTAKTANSCRVFMQDQYARQQSQASTSASKSSSAPLNVRIVQFCLVPPNEQISPRRGSTLQEDSAGQRSPSDVEDLAANASDPCSAPNKISLYIALFPKQYFPLAKAFWQHTGDGISSRLAERCLQILAETGKLTNGNGTTSSGTAMSPSASVSGPSAQSQSSSSAVATSSRGRHHPRNRYYSRNNSAANMRNGHGQSNSDPNSLANSVASLRTNDSSAAGEGEDADEDDDLDAQGNALDQSVYVEERYGRNLPLDAIPLAKCALRRRIAGTLLADREMSTHPKGNGHALSKEDKTTQECNGSASARGDEESTRTGTGVTEDDVFLYPTGMSAIFHAHQVAMMERGKVGDARGVGKSVCFGFPYADTLKVLQKWGPGCHHLGHGTDADIDELERLLEENAESNEAPILALFCEFPSNPMLRSPNLPRLRKLADQYKFIIVVDETIGNFVNVEVLPFSDIVVSSLTKVFSGDTNVMGGSLVLNPSGPKAKTLREALLEDYEDSYWGEDAVFMERNSRDFIHRVNRINENTEALCEMLLEESKRTEGRVITKIQYPKYETKENYDVCRRKESLLPQSGRPGGYGGLFSIFFPSETAAKAFYDALPCAKGPSLGTNFTLASPYAILAHYAELDWAAQFGVERTLIRISVGLERVDELLSMFSNAADAARAAVAAAHK